MNASADVNADTVAADLVQAVSLLQGVVDFHAAGLGLDDRRSLRFAARLIDDVVDHVVGECS